MLVFFATSVCHEGCVQIVCRNTNGGNFDLTMFGTIDGSMRLICRAARTMGLGELAAASQCMANVIRIADRYDVPCLVISLVQCSA